MGISRITPIIESAAKRTVNVVSDRRVIDAAEDVLQNAGSIPKANRVKSWYTPFMDVIKWVSERGFVKKAGEHVKNNNRKYIDGLGVASIIAKDGLGCYLYVTQSLNNKEIPDDKRGFVASLDLTNGLLMILLQIAMFFTVSHKVCQTKMFDKIFGKMFDRPIRKTYQALVKNQPGYEKLKGLDFKPEFEKIRENVKDAFGGLTSLAAATIVGKRMLVPFIATPLAGKVEKKMNEKYEAKKAAEQNANGQVEDKSNPSMKGAKLVEKTVAEPAKVETPAQSYDDKTSNLLERYKNNYLK